MLKIWALICFQVKVYCLETKLAQNLIITWHLLQIVFSLDIGQAVGIAAVAGIALAVGTALAAAAS